MSKINQHSKAIENILPTREELLERGDWIEPDFARERQFDEMMVDEFLRKVSRETRPKTSREINDNAGITIEARSLWSPDWSENHE